MLKIAKLLRIWEVSRHFIISRVFAVRTSKSFALYWFDRSLLKFSDEILLSIALTSYSLFEVVRKCRRHLAEVIEIHVFSCWNRPKLKGNMCLDHRIIGGESWSGFLQLVKGSLRNQKLIEFAMLKDLAFW